MTTFGEEMAELATELCEEFSVGTYTYFESDTDYDTTTGRVTNNPISVHNIPAARYDYSEENRVNRTFAKKVWVVVMDGFHLGVVVPVEGGIVEFPDGSQHVIEDVETDQYGAAYILYVQQKARVIP